MQPSSSGSIQAFQKRPVLEPIDKKLCAIDQFENKLFLGDEAGTVWKYNINVEKTSDMIYGKENSNKLGKKIITLKYIEGVNFLLAQVEKQLHLLDAESLVRLQEIIPSNQNNCELFCLDEEPKSIVRLAVARSDGKVTIFDLEGKNFVARADSLNCHFKADAMAWYGKNLFLGFERKPYQVLDIDTRKPRDIDKLKDLQLPKHVLRIISEDEILILGPADCMIPFNTTTCEQLNKGVIEIPAKFSGISVSSPYVILLAEDRIQINNRFEVKGRRRLLQEIMLDKDSFPGKAISTSERVFFIASNKVFCLSQVPYEIQIDKCFMEGKVDDALLVFEQYVSEDDPEKTKKLEALKLDAAWVYLKIGNMSSPKEILKDINFDPREFLLWYPEFLPKNKELIQNMNPSEISYKGYQIEKNKNEKAAQEFLVFVLEGRRKYLNDLVGSNEQQPPKYLTSKKFSFFKDEVNKNKLKGLTAIEMLELIDFAIIKLYFGLYSPKFKDNLKAFLTANTPYCKSMIAELENFMPSEIKNRSEPNSALAALFYEQFSKIKDALDLWRSLGVYNDAKIAETAAEETIRILRGVKDRNIIFEYLEWVAKQYPQKLGKFLKGVNDQVMNREKTIEWIKKVDKDDKNGLKEKYLEAMVLENKVIDDTSHTMLALHYVQDRLFQIRPKGKRDDSEYKNNPKFIEYREKFQNFLHNEEARYNAESVLHEIKDEYLFEEEIFLCGKLKNHDKAMEKLLDSKSYFKAEEYCAGRNEKLLTALFKKYISRYEGNVKDGGPKEIKKEYIPVISSFLKKYASHSQLDPIEVLNSIPNDFPLKEDGDDNGVYTFLFSAFSSTLHERRNVKMSKEISEMDLFNSECNLFKAQGAHVKITKYRKCDVCGSLIGKKAFVVYPNGVVADRNCTSDNFKVCPVTKQDFEKSFTG